MDGGSGTVRVFVSRNGRAGRIYFPGHFRSFPVNWVCRMRRRTCLAGRGTEGLEKFISPVISAHFQSIGFAGWGGGLALQVEERKGWKIYSPGHFRSFPVDWVCRMGRRIRLADAELAFFIFGKEFSELSTSRLPGELQPASRRKRRFAPGMAYRGYGREKSHGLARGGCQWIFICSGRRQFVGGERVEPSADYSYLSFDNLRTKGFGYFKTLQSSCSSAQQP